jgi:hypothetical protein
LTGPPVDWEEIGSLPSMFILADFLQKSPQVKKPGEVLLGLFLW